MIIISCIRNLFLCFSYSLNIVVVLHFIVQHKYFCRSHNIKIISMINELSSCTLMSHKSYVVTSRNVINIYVLLLISRKQKVRYLNDRECVYDFGRVSRFTCITYGGY